ncbi:MAG TPA: A24 family peptidase [Burkholderiales bacterium]|nr:A24 family peptidase [Burkholderiales bacterium]
MSVLSDPSLAIFIAIVFGLAIGSFLNVVIHRLPKMMERQWRAECAQLNDNTSANTATETPIGESYNLFVPRSRCPVCTQPITALQNIPVISYLVLGGKCAACKTRISPRYPLVELISGVFAGYATWRFGFTLAGAGALLFAFAMIALTFIDLDTFYLPDDITLPLLWAGLLLNLGNTFVDLPSAVIGAACGYLALWLVFWLFKLVTGKEGMGYGDFKLLAAIGAWLGWQILPLVILLSSLVGAIIGIGLMIFARHGRETPIPFGPYLAIAGMIALFHGQAINHRYLNLF